MHTPSVETRRDPLGDARLRALARRVLEYVMDHQEAKDTAEGIRGWWLGERDPAGPEEMESVLRSLVARGWLSSSGSTEVVYGLRPAAAQDVRGFLAERTGNGAP